MTQISRGQPAKFRKKYHFWSCLIVLPLPAMLSSDTLEDSWSGFRKLHRWNQTTSLSRSVLCTQTGCGSQSCIRLWSFTSLSTKELLIRNTKDWSWDLLHYKHMLFNWAMLLLVSLPPPPLVTTILILKSHFPPSHMRLTSSMLVHAKVRVQGGEGTRSREMIALLFWSLECWNNLVQEWEERSSTIRLYQQTPD